MQLLCHHGQHGLSSRIGEVGALDGLERLNRRRVPYVTRMLMELFDSGDLPNVKSLQVEPNYGYFCRIEYRDGSNRYTSGNDVGINVGAACDLAKDKIFTKHFLALGGFTSPRGSGFLLPWWSDRIGEGSVDTKGVSADIARYVDVELSYPVYLKPVRGSKGHGVVRVSAASGILDVVSSLESERVRVVVVEEAVTFPDFRVVVLGDRVISAYRRNPLFVIGDGRRTLDELLQARIEEYRQHGRAEISPAHMAQFRGTMRRQGHEGSAIPNHGERVVLSDVSNLSMGGSSEDLTETMHHYWRQLCVDIARHMNLNLCGIDLACPDLTSDTVTDYSVIEVNAAPGLDHYASSGEAQAAIVRSLYAQVFNMPPTAHRDSHHYSWSSTSEFFTDAE